MVTQRPLTTGELTAVLSPLGRPVAAEPLGGGAFAAVHAVTLDDGRDVVVKTGAAATPGPAGRPPLLTYERDLLRTETLLLRHAARAAVPTPRVLLADLTREHADVDVLVMERLPGVTWEGARATMAPEADVAAQRATGAVLATLHRLTGDRFGYPSAPALGGATWPSAFGAMVASLLDDARVWDVDVEADRVRRAVEVCAPDLADVGRPALVHMDLWPGNVLVDAGTGTVTGVVDLERGLYGDPLLDLAGADPMSSGAPAPALVEGYLGAGGTLPRDADAGAAGGLTPSADRRLSLYRLYIVLIMTIEVVPRAYAWDGVAGYVRTLRELRAVLLDRLGV